jgi:hypothetical protein
LRATVHGITSAAMICTMLRRVNGLCIESACAAIRGGPARPDAASRPRAVRCARAARRAPSTGCAQAPRPAPSWTNASPPA